MNNFDFYNPTHIVFGKDRLGELDNLIPKDAKVLIVYGGGSVKKYGTLDKVKAGLGNRTTIEFGGIEPNPKFETAMKAAAMAKEEEVDFLLAIGGGSVMDTTKFAALVSKYDGDKPESLLYHGFNPVPVNAALPLGTVVTLPATGSEMNPAGVITFNRAKLVFVSPLVYPKFSFLDPALTFSVPQIQVANGVVDAFVHVVEQYLTFPVDAKFQDRTAEGILQTLIEIGRHTIDEPNDYKARSNLVWSATMALNGLLGAGVPQDWTTHVIGNEMTALFGIDHGKALAVVLPSLLNKRKAQKREKLLQFAERVWNLEDGDDDSKIDSAIDKTRAFFESLGVKTRLSDYDIGEEGIAAVIKAMEMKKLTRLSESGDLTPDICREILEAAI